MAQKLREHESVGKEYLAGVKRPAVVYDFPFPAKQLWASLLDGPAWGEWLDGLEVEWTSPKPFGEGTTRTVKLGNMVIEEYFFGWEEGKRMSFRFARSTLPIRALIEDYHVIENPDNPNACRLEWGVRVSAMFPLNFLVKWQVARGFKAGMPKLEQLIKSNPSRFGG